MKLKLSNKGLSLIELLAYISLIGMIVGLTSGLLSNVYKSYDRINGQGAIINEGNSIISTLFNYLNNVEAQYVSYCPDTEIGTCITITHKPKIIVNNGVIEYQDTGETTTIRIVDQDLYINQIKINHRFKLTSATIEIHPTLDSITGTYQNPIIEMDFKIATVSKNGEVRRESKLYTNRFVIK